MAHLNEVSTRSLVGQVLACTGIVVLVSALLIPAFAQSKSGKRPSCLSRMKQNAFGLLMYSGDNDQFLPQAWTWMDATQPYLQRSYTLRCVYLDKDKKGFGTAANMWRAGKKVDEKTSDLLAFDSDDLSWNATRSILNANLTRHQGRGIVAFENGQAKSLTKTDLLAMTKTAP